MRYDDIPLGAVAKSDALDIVIVRLSEHLDMGDSWFVELGTGKVRWPNEMEDAMDWKLIMHSTSEVFSELGVDLHLTLVAKIDYWSHGTEKETLEKNLLNIMWRAATGGEITGDSRADVCGWDVRVHQREPYDVINQKEGE